MFKVFMSFICIMVISVSSVSAYSPQDNPIQQLLYDTAGVYLGETTDELNQQNKLRESKFGGGSIVSLEDIGFNGVIVRKNATVNFFNNQLYYVGISFDDKNVEKTKKIQTYFVDKLGQPISITQPTEDMKQMGMTAENYYWTTQTCSILVGQGHIIFIEETSAQEVSKLSLINYIKSVYDSTIHPDKYYVGEVGKKFFDANTKVIIDSYKETFKKNPELANYVKTYFADKPEYAETLKLFFE